MIGLELFRGAAIAVAVDDAGCCLARAAIDVTAGLEAAANAAIDALAAFTSPSIGVAAVNPDAASVAAVLEALAARPFVAPPLRSGTAAAVAEAWCGAAGGAKDLVYFGVDLHTSAGILRGGVPVVGAHGRAGGAAWLALNPVERENYRKSGCLEAEVASAGIVRRLIWRLKAGDTSSVLDAAGGDLTAIVLGHVMAAAREGDGVAISVVRDTAKYLGMAAANLVAVTDPEALVLGGIMASSADLLLEPVRTEIARRLPAAIMADLTIVPAALGADAPAIGAARVASAVAS